jgi:hypothetical protein
VKGAWRRGAAPAVEDLEKEDLVRPHLRPHVPDVAWVRERCENLADAVAQPLAVEVDDLRRAGGHGGS